MPVLLRPKPVRAHLYLGIGRGIGMSTLQLDGRKFWLTRAGARGLFSWRASPPSGLTPRRPRSARLRPKLLGGPIEAAVTTAWRTPPSIRRTMTGTPDAFGAFQGQNAPIALTPAEELIPTRPWH